MSEINEAYIKIYKQAQAVAAKLASQFEFKVSPESFSSFHPSNRVKGYFEIACNLLHFINGHEMQDIVEEVEQNPLNEKLWDVSKIEPSPPPSSKLTQNDLDIITQVSNCLGWHIHSADLDGGVVINSDPNGMSLFCFDPLFDGNDFQTVIEAQKVHIEFHPSKNKWTAYLPGQRSVIWEKNLNRAVCLAVIQANKEK